MSSVTTHNQLISKELLSKVMDLDIEYIDDEIPKSPNLPEQSESNVYFTVKDRAGEYYFINKYELALKTKKWIYNNTDYYILSHTTTHAYVYPKLFSTTEDPVQSFGSFEEYKSILYACEWIFNNPKPIKRPLKNLRKKFNINASDLCTVSFNKEEMPMFLYKEYEQIPNAIKDKYDERSGGGEYLYFWTIPSSSIPSIKGQYNEKTIKQHQIL